MCSTQEPKSEFLCGGPLQRDHDLADLLITFEVPVCLDHIFESKYAVHFRIAKPKPTIANQLLGLQASNPAESRAIHTSSWGGKVRGSFAMSFAA